MMTSAVESQQRQLVTSKTKNSEQSSQWNLKSERFLIWAHRQFYITTLRAISVLALLEISVWSSQRLVIVKQIIINYFIFQIGTVEVDAGIAERRLLAIWKTRCADFHELQLFRRTHMLRESKNKNKQWYMTISSVGLSLLWRTEQNLPHIHVF